MQGEIRVRKGEFQVYDGKTWICIPRIVFTFEKNFVSGFYFDLDAKSKTA